jgi:hypothetical protein
MSGSYRDIKAWQKAIELVVEICSCTRNFPREEIYGLANQLRHQLTIAGRLGYVTQAEVERIGNSAGEIARMLSGLIKSIRSGVAETGTSEEAA